MCKRSIPAKAHREEEGGIEAKIVKLSYLSKISTMCTNLLRTWRVIGVLYDKSQKDEKRPKEKPESSVLTVWCSEVVARKIGQQPCRPDQNQAAEVRWPLWSSVFPKGLIKAI